jgi:uncharacterized protein (DUF736 family)
MRFGLVKRLHGVASLNQKGKNLMASIGTFNKVEGKYIGTLESLLFKSQATLEPVTDKKREKSPDFRLFAGSREIGAAWKRKSQEGAEYLSVTIDDPVFPAPINGRLVKVSIEGQYMILWTRERD